MEDEIKEKPKKKIKAIRVRATKFRAYNPKTKQSKVYFAGDEIKPVWPEIIRQAEQDVNHRSLVIIYDKKN